MAGSPIADKPTISREAYPENDHQSNAKVERVPNNFPGFPTGETLFLFHKPALKELGGAT